jgi:hypothetical protein
MPPHRPILLALLVFAALAAPAGAAQFYVDDSSPAPVAGCQDQAHPCTTINAALTASRALAGTGDTITVASGTYDEDLVVDQPQDDGLTISGPSTGSAALIQHISNAVTAVQLGASSAPFNQNLTLEHVTIGVPIGAGLSKYGVRVYGIGTTLDNVGVVINDTNATAIGILLASTSGTDTLHKVIVLNKGSGAGMFVFSPAIVTDSAFAPLGTNVGANGIVVLTTSAHIEDTLTRLPAGGAANGIAIAGAGADVTVDSSLLEGGHTGVLALSSASGTVHALVRRSTVDVATAGVDDGGFAGASVEASTNTASDAVAKIDVDQSLLVDKPDTKIAGGMGTPTVACVGSMLPLVSGSGVTCDASGGNSFAAPSALFQDAATLDYKLKTDAPAIDAGTGVEPGEPDHDDSNKPRNVDGNFDCTARPDLGAYELQGQANTAPTVSADGPATGAAGDVLTFTATGSDAEDTPDKLTYAWAFSDGGSAAGASAQHAFTAGAQSATVTVTDSHGCTASAKHDVTVSAAATAPGPGDGPAPGPLDTTPPVVSKLSVKKGRLRFTLSEAAAVSAALMRRTCTRVAGAKRCKLHPVTALQLSGKQGANAAKLPRLARGTYTLSLVARDAAGNASKARKLRVRMK